LELAASTALTSPRHYTELGVGGNRRFTVARATPPASQAELDWEAAPGRRGWVVKLLVYWLFDSTTNPIFLFRLKQKFLSLVGLSPVTSYILPVFSIFEFFLVLTCVLLFPKICSWYLVRSPPVPQSTAASTALTSPRHYTELGVGGNQRFTVARATPPASQAELDWEAAPIALQREPARKGREGTRRGIAPGGS
jgi:hypothetical protein